MATEISICNLALGHLGQQGKVTSISPPDGYAHSAKCATFYPIARDVCLESGAWPFAQKRVALSAVTPAVASTQYPYAFAVPSDMLAPTLLLPVGAIDEDVDGLDFIVEGDTLFTVDSAPYLKYTRVITDTTKFSPLFVSALSWLLASYLAGSITDDKAVKVWCMDNYTNELSNARSSNGRRTQRANNFTPGGIASR